MTRDTSFSTFKRLVKEDWAVNDRSWLRPGCQAMVMYRFGVWRSGIRPRALRAPFGLLYRLAHVVVRNYYGIELHSSAEIGRRLRIAHQSAIVVHQRAVIGDDCMIRQGVTIGISRVAGNGKQGVPIIGNRVEIGAGAAIIGGVRIGDGAIIGPNVVVMQDVPAGVLVVAPMARVIPLPKSSTAREVSTL